MARTLRLRFLTLSVLGIVAVPIPGSAQTVKVSGTVENTAGHPLTEAEVELLGTGRSLRTPPSGWFEFDGLTPGRHDLRVIAIGYRPVSVTLVVKPISGWSGLIQMTPAEVQLPEVTVTARADRPPEYIGVARYDDFFRRQRLGFGTFLTRADIDRMGTLDVLGVLRGIPGVVASMNVSPFGAPTASLRIARCPMNPPRIAVYINGNRQYMMDSMTGGSELSRSSMAFVHRKSGSPQSRCDACEELAEVLTSVSIRDVEPVEFYRGVAQIPGDLARDVCAVLGIWTR